MRKITLCVIVALCSVLYAQSNWQQAFTLLDDIELSIKTVQDTNSNLLKQNNDLQIQLNSMSQNLGALETIMHKQSQLLTQWEMNWNEMMELYEEQSKQLQHSENACKIYKWCIPITTVLGIIIGMVIWNELD